MPHSPDPAPRTPTGGDGVPVPAARWRGEDYAAHSAHHRGMDEQFLDRHRPGERDVVVDLGCGSGEFTAVLAGLAPRGTVTGIDADASMLAAARRHRAANLKFVRADATRVHAVLPPASVDLVVSRAMLHWLPSNRHPALYRAVRQVLRPGGVFHLEAAGPGNIPAIIALMDELAARHGVPAPPAFPDPGRAFDLLEQAGFDVGSDGVRTQAMRRPFSRDQIAGLLSSQVALVLTRHVDPARAQVIARQAVEAVDRLRRHDGSYDQTFVRLEILVRRG